MRYDGTAMNRFISLFRIHSCNTFQHSIHNDRNGVITNHTIIILPP